MSLNEIKFDEDKIKLALAYLNPPFGDYREEKSGIFVRLDEMNLNYIKEQNKYGDWVYGKIFAIEVKREYIGGESDLRDSLWKRDKRLYKELQNQRNNFAHSFLILEGDMAKIKETTRNFKAFCDTINIDYNTHIFISTCIEDTIKLIYAIWYRLRNGSPDKIFLQNKQTSSERQKKINLLASLHNTGIKKAEVLLNEFKTPEKVIEWIKLKGKGKYIYGFGKKWFESNYKLYFEEVEF